MIKSKRAKEWIFTKKRPVYQLAEEDHVVLDLDAEAAVEIAEEEIHAKTRREDRERAVIAMCTVYCRAMVSGCRPEARACCETRRRFLNVYDDERPIAGRV